jgi:hypothetical protein
MKKLIILLFGLYLFSNIAKAQSYTLSSFEGNKVNIKLKYEGNGVLKINYLNDTLTINYFLAVDKIKVLNKIFLQIYFARLAGSNENFEDLLLLCVNHGKLVQALHINSQNLYDMRNFGHFKGEESEYSLFNVKAKLIGKRTDYYKLAIHVHNEHFSDWHKKSNFKYNKQSYLNFDLKADVFYSNYEFINGSFKFFNGVYDSTGTKKIIKQQVPVVKIDKDKYYYVKGNWYNWDKKEFVSVSS